MKNVQRTLIIMLFLIISTLLFAQENMTEKTFPLSKAATKGYLYYFEQADNGEFQVTYKMANKKKELYQIYSIDANLTNAMQKDEEVIKDKSIVNNDYERTYIYAYIGGKNSFDVLSTKLKLTKVTAKYTWDKDKQTYNSQYLTRDKVVLKSLDDKAYEGYMDFSKSNGDVLVLTAQNVEKNKQFFLLNIKPDLTFTETPLKMNGVQTLVFAKAIAHDSLLTDDEADISKADIVMIFAPEEKSKTEVQYTYIRADNNGSVLEQFNFASPSPNLAITEIKLLKDGHVLMFGAYTKSKDTFSEVFGEYGPIISPGIVAQDKDGNQNLRMNYYNKNIEKEDMSTMFVANINNGSVAWMKEILVKEFKNKLKKAPNQKKAPQYDGKAFKIFKLDVLDNADMLVSGQIVGRMSLGLANPHKAYRDLICFHFDANGNVKAQYGYTPESLGDKLNTLYPIYQMFLPTSDNNTVAWVFLENRTENGYDSFSDAFNEVKSYYPVYYPNIMKIDVNQASINNSVMLGNGDFRLNKRFPFIYSAEKKCISFLGRDEKNKNIWLCNYKL